MEKYDNNFLSEADMIDCLQRGCEVEFLYQNKKYSITHTKKSETSIIEYGNIESEKTYSTPEKLMSHYMDNKQLRDIIKDMKIIDRSF